MTYFRTISFLLTWICATGLSIGDCHAQLKIYPAERSSHINTYSTVNARTKAAVLTLPFWDDFAVSNGPHPDSTKWVDSKSVWINNTVGINQPTLNVATFDGLNSSGLPYSADDILATGYTDTLTSKPIDLAATDVDRGSLFLSFFYQWQGAGESPDPSDFLELLFKDDKGTWQSIVTIFPETDFERRVFYDTLIQIDSSIYFHNNFQFRFRSYGRESGPFDTWNIDYVYLNDGRTNSELSFPDRAAASLPTSLFGEYTAIPYRHFRSAASVDTVKLDIQNLKGQDLQSVEFSVTGEFVNYFANGTTRIFNALLMPQTGVRRNAEGERTGIMTPYERVTSEFDTGLPDPNNTDQFDPAATAVDVTLKFTVVSGDETDPDRAELAPVDLRVNDTISRTFALADYYAYDDGTAEYAAGLITAGTVVAYQFERLSTFPDTLIGFDIYFPPYGITSNQTVNFFVFPDINGKPGESLINILKGIQRKNVNEFQSVRFSPALLITGQRFYIGWQQPLAGKAIVGLDADNDTGDRIFFTSDRTSWFQNQNVSGSLMIRPVFGSGEVNPIIPGIEEELGLKIYPNPGAGVFNIEGVFDDLRVYNSLGSEVSYSLERIERTNKLLIAQDPGLYILRITKGNRTVTHKLLLTR